MTLIILKYVICAAILGIVWIFPSWLAVQAKKDKTTVGMIRLSSWLFGWTGVGWLIGLYWAAK